MSLARRTRGRDAAAVFATAVACLAPAPVAAQIEDPFPQPIRQIGLKVDLEAVAAGMTAPNWGTAAPGIDGRLFVADQDGILWDVDLDTGGKSVFLDVSSRLVSLGVGGPGTFDERGFLGVAFHPGYLGNGLLYTYTSEPVAGPADFSTLPEGVSPNHQSVVTEWQVPEPANPGAVVDPASAREVLRIDQPQFNHDAGALVFDPEGRLHVALGDGGGADDQGVGHAPGGNGQDPGNPLGTILRIDPLGVNAASGQYGIPNENPFVGQTGVLDEILAFGFRNPFRISFDRATGDLYAADVGQNDIEEIDVVVAGGNYGWRIKEGPFCFDPNGADPGFVFLDPSCMFDDLIDPVAAYDHDEGIAVIGGFVYRGEAVAKLRGRYVFGDFVNPALGRGRVFHLRKRDIVRGERTKTSRISELRIQGGLPAGFAVLGFGEDAAGELYVLANTTGVPFGDTGVVLKIVPAGPQ